MGEAIICKRGAAGAPDAVDGYALICAAYPAGSSCTCTKGTEVLEVENGGGTSAFAVGGSGTWTVAVSNGTRSKSGTVTVGAGEIKTIRLSYDADPIVTGDGVLLSAANGLAGGYTLNGNASMSGNMIHESGNGGFWLSPAVDLSGFSTLTVSGVLRELRYAASRIGVGSTSAKVYDYTQTPEAYADWSLAVDQPYTVSIDVSALTGAWTIGSTSIRNNLDITSITLS